MSNSEVNMDNLFEKATRQKLLFECKVGQINTEQLWDLPLLSKNGLDLDTVAKTAKRQLDAASEESFVSTTSPAKALAELKLEVVKHIISVKLAEKDAATKKASKAELRKQLTAALAEKQIDDLKGMTATEIEKRLAELDD
ncbi:hypothetical protein D3C76_27470 [compost metagenome]